MIVVFDFDKTLTYRDTLFGFFWICSPSGFSRMLRLFIYGISMIAHKLDLFSNDGLKRLGVRLFLRGRSRQFLSKCGEEYARTIKLNRIYHTEFTKYEKPYLVSASFIEYLAPLFPSAKIFCSQIQFDRDDKVESLKVNCYGETKSHLLRAHGISSVDVIYTDSMSDFPLAQMAEQIYLVRGDEVLKCCDLQEFSRLASK